MKRIIAAMLIVIGLAGILYGGISYVNDRRAVELGPMSMQIKEKKTIPIPPVAGTIAVVAGVVLLMVPNRRLTGS